MDWSILFERNHNRLNLFRVESLVHEYCNWNQKLSKNFQTLITIYNYSLLPTLQFLVEQF